MSFLSLLVFSPLLGIILLAFVRRTDTKTIQWLGTAATVPPLLLALFAFIQSGSGFRLEQLDESYDWVRLANLPFFTDAAYVIRYELGIDGLSLLFIVLTAVLGTLAAVASLLIKVEKKGYFMWLLALEIGMLGVFAAANFIWFFLFLEVTLVAMFLLVGKWGGFERERAAYGYLLYNGLGSALLLVVIAVLVARTGTANFALLHETLHNPVAEGQLIAPLTAEARYWLLGGLLLAFAVKLPAVPLHRWLVRVHVEAPPPVVMLHAGVLLKIATYGMIRFGIGLFPDEFRAFAGAIAVLGVINILYGALLALRQRELKHVLAYSSVSHMGVVLVGLGALNEAGIQGAVFQSVAHGLIAALSFLLVGVLANRIGTTDIHRLGGLAKAMPIFSGYLLTAALALLGLPGLAGFVGELTAFLGLFETKPALAAAGALGLIFAAVYSLRAILDITFGHTRERYESTLGLRGSKESAASVSEPRVIDLQAKEAVPAFVLVALIVAVGVYPQLLAEPLATVLETMMNGLGG
ncbi:MULTISPECIES: NADH-quinone oxidoreductase subunit M [Geobacillus]|jgi:NADH-quinone oxidoreductase subunit M|uniref:NADH-quinone oxidoreductase subunit M n=1 Tax=Geobacillus thermodenitrificans TaxID=33940 RepID=A0ABY9QFD4_GEOTD|nr:MULTISPECIES: NADH-quinone oxidoreductase subunit M [Geobacillus]ARP44366.1 NAD(P)H-quinone oxidoreductase chain 4 1 [Geobacillus thermodenitrificans]MED3906869.1 NADH-quinone oxidoreductase subunit M [Geobacillus thermodenitrificans]NNU87456.1 NADH-quinone oxidoreductase subunit M [Geobacillus sp. MR]WMV76139.1 NADH-quinone oxidoreductase subunit M [Geobacillus thermodenitrificans]